MLLSFYTFGSLEGAGITETQGVQDAIEIITEKFGTMRDDVSWEPVRSVVPIISQSSTAAMFSIPHLCQPSLPTKPAAHRPPDSLTALLHLCLCSRSQFNRTAPFRALKSENPPELSTKSLANFSYISTN